MRFEIRLGEIEMIPENHFDEDIVEKIHQARMGNSRGTVVIKDGRTSDQNYPPRSRKTNVVFVLP